MHRNCVDRNIPPLRYLCLAKLNSMESIKDLKHLLSNSYDLGSEHWVDVTHINTPHSFYARPTFLRRYLTILNTYEDQPMPDAVYVGVVIIFESTVLNNFVRGRVTFIHDDNPDEYFYDIFAIDYGCLENSVPLNKIRLPCHPTNVPPLAIHCQLADCKPRKDMWTKEAMETMQFFIGSNGHDNKMIVREKTPNSFVVEMFNSGPDDISMILTYAGHSTLYTDNLISKFALIPEKHYYKFKEYHVDDVLTVRIQGGESLKNFYVAEMDEYKALLEEKDKFKFYCQTQKELQPADILEGMAVGAYLLSQDKYERGLVMELCPRKERALVLLVDWGKIIQLPFTRMKRATEKFFDLNVTGLHCRVEDSQLGDTNLQNYLYPGHKCYVTIRKLGTLFETPHVVKIIPSCRY